VAPPELPATRTSPDVQRSPVYVDILSQIQERETHNVPRRILVDFTDGADPRLDSVLHGVGRRAWFGHDGGCDPPAPIVPHHDDMFNAQHFDSVRQHRFPASNQDGRPADSSEIRTSLGHSRCTG
jgi:hypothetical protein